MRVADVKKVKDSGNLFEMVLEKTIVGQHDFRQFCLIGDGFPTVDFIDEMKKTSSQTMVDNMRTRYMVSNVSIEVERGKKGHYDSYISFDLFGKIEGGRRFASDVPDILTDKSAREFCTKTKYIMRLSELMDNYKMEHKAPVENNPWAKRIVEFKKKANLDLLNIDPLVFANTHFNFSQTVPTVEIFARDLTENGICFPYVDYLHLNSDIGNVTLRGVYGLNITADPEVDGAICISTAEKDPPKYIDVPWQHGGSHRLTSVADTRNKEEYALATIFFSPNSYPKLIDFSCTMSAVVNV